MKYIYEKYSLQEYEGKIRDAILDEINELNKISPIVSLFLHKYKVFITTREIFDRDLRCVITLFYYDRESGNPNSKISDDNFIGPDDVDGVTAYDKVYAYIPVSFKTSPFVSKSLNSKFNNICDDYTDELHQLDGWLHTDNYNSISKETNKLKQKYRYVVDEIMTDISDSNVPVKKTLNIDAVFAIKTILHELTHVMDQPTAARVNHFTGLNIDNADKYGLELALNILYSLWSRTEFNAFTQTFGRDIDVQRNIVKSKYINKVSLQYLSRACSDGGNITFDEFISNVYDSLNELSDTDYDSNFWDTVKSIVVEGSKESSTAERFEKMSPLKFRNYFIRTTLKLIEKLQDKVVKNIASQNSYDRDISNIAAEIKDACSKYTSDDMFDVSFEFNCYSKKQQASYKIYVNMETPDVELSDSAISNSSIIHLTVSQLNVGWDLTPRQLFGRDSNSYTEMYKELATDHRKTKLDRLYINFAEDLNNVTSKLISRL